MSAFANDLPVSTVSEPDPMCQCGHDEFWHAGVDGKGHCTKNCPCNAFRKIEDDKLSN